MGDTKRDAMHLGLFVAAHGHHAGGWRYPDAEFGGPLDPDFYKQIAVKAERAKLDMIFIADGLSIKAVHGNSFELAATYRPSVSAEPLTLVAALSAVTDKIGLAATASTTYHKPFHIARMFATLDHLSKGRAAWNAVTSTGDDEARNFGKPAHLEHAVRYERADECIEVVKALWDSWEDDAVRPDKVTGVFADAGKVHAINHKGKWFDVRGPLNVSRPPQGRPVIIQAGASETFRESAARHADVVFTAQPNLQSAQSFYADLKSRVARRGRSPEEVSILPGVMPIVGATEKEAHEKRQLLDALIHPQAGLCFMSGSMNYDLSQHPPDGPFPDIEDRIRGSRGRFQYVFRKAKEEGLTLAEVGRWYAASRSHHIVVGTPDSVADTLALWFRERGCDGFNLMAPYMPGGLDDILERVVPELQNRGVFREDYAGCTLRDHFGLRRPDNVFAAGAKQSIS